MISKEKVLKIMRDIEKVNVETAELNKNRRISRWSDSKIALYEYIANLEDDEIIDLLALMAYGRDLYNMPRDVSYEDFSEIRKNLFIENLTDEEKHNKADYLLGKAYLSNYLRQVLSLCKE